MKEVSKHSLVAGIDASLWHQPEHEIDIGDDNDDKIDYDVDKEEDEETLMKVLPQTRHWIGAVTV